MRRGIGQTKTTTIYAEKYYRRKNTVMPNNAASIVAEADAIYCDEQGEIEIPSLGKQRRMFVVLRLERIIRDDGNQQVCRHCPDKLHKESDGEWCDARSCLHGADGHRHEPS